MAQKLSALLLVLCLLSAFAGCSKLEDVTPASGASHTDTAAASFAESVSGESTTDASPTPEDDDDEANFDDGATADNQGVLSSGETIEYYVPGIVKNPGDRTVTLFIWNVDSWKTVQWNYRDTLTAKKLLQGLAYVTNWDLTCEVKPATQQLTFRWDKASSLYSGIPLKQNKEYWVGNQKELDACILDSVYKTMLENLGPSYTVYYADAEGGDLELTDVGVTIPANMPFSSFWNY